MAVKKGIVSEKQFVVEVEGREYLVPEGCSTIKESQLRAIVGKDVEVLMANDTVLAIRPVDMQYRGPILTCYLVPNNIAFGEEVMRKIEPMITEQLVESGYLAKDIADNLRKWQTAPC